MGIRSPEVSILYVNIIFSSSTTQCHRGETDTNDPTTIGDPKKKPRLLWKPGFLMVSLTMSYFHWKYNQLSSAIRCFTVLFGMGRRGTTSLWSSGKGCVRKGRILCRIKLYGVPTQARRSASQGTKTPGFLRNRGLSNGEPDDVLLSLEIQPTIIGDKVFHCPVRNGKEWDHLSMVIRQRLCPQGTNLLLGKKRSGEQ